MASMVRRTVKADFPTCAFCKYWYDPANMHIAPKAPKMDQWEYDRTAYCKCLRKNTMKDAGGGAGCRDYVCKIPLMLDRH